jgi:hypothetical protein
MNSCVNNKGKVFKRTLWKQMKVSENTVLVKVDLHRDLLTKLGLHMNTKRKQLAAKTVTTINSILNEKKKEPISMK